MAKDHKYFNLTPAGANCLPLHGRGTTAKLPNPDSSCRAHLSLDLTSPLLFSFGAAHRLCYEIVRKLFKNQHGKVVSTPEKPVVCCLLWNYFLFWQQLSHGCIDLYYIVEIHLCIVECLRSSTQITVLGNITFDFPKSNSHVYWANFQ